jgi:hypothetical protein
MLLIPDLLQDPFINISGNGAGGNVLLDGVVTFSNTTNNLNDTTSPGDTYQFLNNQYQPNPSLYAALPEVNCCNNTAITNAFAQLMNDKPTVPAGTPAGVTDVRIYAVRIDNSHYGIHVKN